MCKLGIDVSHYQLKIDWETLKRETNIDFAILKVGEGRFDNQKDDYFERNYQECKRLGIEVGVYFYSYAQTPEEAKVEASFCLKWLQNRDLDLPVYMDCESKQLESARANLEKIVISFNEEIEKAGYWAGVYANKFWWENRLTPKIKELYTSWIAHYQDYIERKKYLGKYDMYQYTSQGKLEGIRGNVDLNIMYRDLAKDISRSKKTKEAIKEVNKKEITEDLIDAVIRGDFGNGDIRKNLIEREGFNYEEVQSKVNEKLASVSQIYYTIKKGDTLSQIAYNYGTSVLRLTQLNNIKDANKIYAGQVIRIK